MKFNLIKKILFFLGLIVFLANCSSSNKYEDYEKLKIVNLDKKTKTTLHSSLKDNIFALDVYISGEVKGKGKLRFYHPPYENFTEVIVEGPINQMYTIDWYTNDALIEYIPIDIVDGGNIILKYKFLQF